MFAVSQPINNMNFNYDSGHDVLHLTFGSPEVSYADELAPGIFIRFSDMTDNVTGAIILDFSQRSDQELNVIPMRIDFESIRNQIGR